MIVPSMVGMTGMVPIGFNKGSDRGVVLDGGGIGELRHMWKENCFLGRRNCFAIKYVS